MQSCVGVYLAQMLHKGVCFVLPYIIKKIILTVEIGKLYLVEIIKIKLSDAKTC